MNTYVGRAGEALLIALSTVIAIRYVAPLINDRFGVGGQEVGIAVASAVLYLIIAVLNGLVQKIEVVRQIFDRSRAAYIGQYLSFPSKNDHIGIFKIYYDAQTRQYKLDGTAYSMRTLTLAGRWSSTRVDIHAEDKRLAYIYQGCSFPNGFPNDLHGYSIIRFDNAALLTGKGRYTDDGENRVPMNSVYRKVTPDLMYDITGVRSRKISDSKAGEFLVKFSGLPAEKRKKYRRQTVVSP